VIITLRQHIPLYFLWTASAHSFVFFIVIIIFRPQFVDVESTEVTKVLAEHLVMSALSLDVLYGVRDMEAYRLAIFVALRSISRATCPPTL
jgi:hypothetical protein